MSVVTVDSREGHFGVTLATSDVCEGVKIIRLNSKDLFYRAGLRAGHVVIKVNGRSVSNHERALDTLNECKAAQTKCQVEYTTEDAAALRGAAETKTRHRTVLLLLVGLALFIGAGVAHTWAAAGDEPVARTKQPAPKKKRTSEAQSQSADEIVATMSADHMLRESCESKTSGQRSNCASSYTLRSDARALGCTVCVC
jgi:predicted extracellular nuclease